MIIVTGGKFEQSALEDRRLVGERKHTIHELAFEVG
jgi:hypothetical protein